MEAHIIYVELTPSELRLLRFWCIATSLSISSSPCCGHVSVDEARDGVRTGLAVGTSATAATAGLILDVALPLLRPPISGDPLASTTVDGSSVDRKTKN